VDKHIVQPAATYLTSTSTPNVFNFVAALQQDPAETGTVLGPFAQGKLSITLSAFKTGAPINPNVPTLITALLNLTEDSAGIRL
jgi:hypothetical protein